MVKFYLELSHVFAASLFSSTCPAQKELSKRLRLFIKCHRQQPCESSPRPQGFAAHGRHPRAASRTTGGPPVCGLPCLAELPCTLYACAELKFLGNSESTQAPSLASLARLLTSHALAARALPLTNVLAHHGLPQSMAIACSSLQAPQFAPKRPAVVVKSWSL